MNLIAPLLYAWFLANFEPLQNKIDFIFKYIPNYLQFTRLYFSCFKCISFWLTLFMTGSFTTAILFSLIAYTYDRIINSLKINI